MVVEEDHCCDCAVPGYPCQGSACPNRHVEVHYCDECGCQLETIYINEANGDELCGECFDELNETEEE